MRNTDSLFAGDDLVVLVSWMAREGYTADDIAYAVEKPHKWRDELTQALDDLDAMDTL